MNWQPLTTAPKDHYVLGCDLAQKRPVVMIWNLAESMFVENAGEADISPGFWAPLPRFDSESWSTIESAPQDEYILGYEVGFKRPYVMKWDRATETFNVVSGLGDETPTHWYPLSAPI